MAAPALNVSGALLNAIARMGLKGTRLCRLNNMLLQANDLADKL